MREIRFKAKRKDNGEWIEGYYNGRHIVNWEEREVPVSVTESKKCKIQNMHTIIPETICQNTGSKDKDGNRIWENDIVSRTDLYDANKPHIGIMWYNKKNTSFVVKRMNPCGYSPTFPFRKNTKVVGNIFDNPELLEDGHDKNN